MVSKKVFVLRVVIAVVIIIIFIFLWCHKDLLKNQVSVLYINEKFVKKFAKLLHITTRCVFL